MVTNQLFCSLISWLVSTSWVDIQYPQSMFFHEKWPSFTTFLKICKHVLQFIISARALTKVLYLFCAAGLLSIIYFQGWLWFQCRTLSDFNKCQTWFKNRCLANLNLSDFLAGFLSHLVTSGRCAMWRKTQLRSVFLHWTAQCGQSGHCLKILAAKMTVLLINTSSGYSFCRS